MSFEGVKIAVLAALFILCSMLPLLCASLLAVPQSQDWPQYRGPERTGVVAARDWSATGHTEPLWVKNVGRGYSCPSIVAGRLVTIGFDAAAQVDRIVCLDAKTGAQHWAFAFAASDAPQYHGGGTLTTPLIASGHVYCLNRAGKFHVLELASGKKLWSRDYLQELGLEKTFHGYSASPVLEGDRIYLQLGGLIAAVSRVDGKVLWQSKDYGDQSYSNLAMLDVVGKPALGAVVPGKFFAFARADGEVLQEYDWQLAGSAVHCAVPIQVDASRVFLSTAYNKGAAMLRLGAGKVPERIWSNRRMRNKVTACVLHEGHLYGFDESMLRCIDLDGNSKWRVRGLGLGALSLAGGRLLVISSEGELIVAEASPAGFEELSRRKVLDGGAYWTMPVLVDGLIYVRNSLGDLCCLDHRVDAGSEDVAARDVGVAVPTAAQLFAANAKAIPREALVRKGQALRLRGTWSVPLRGVTKEKMTLTLASSGGGDLRLDEGGLSYTCDGERAWAIEPQGARFLVNEELREVRRLFSMRDLFAPVAPDGATVLTRPVAYAETRCWKVTASVPGASGQPAATRVYYFDVDGGRLRGSAGSESSALLFGGSQQLLGATLPRSMTRYRLEDGQEHVMVFDQAEWVEVSSELFALPEAILRLLRSPAEIASANIALRKRFAKALGRYQATNKASPIGDDIIELEVRDGELWFANPGPAIRICTEAEVDGVLALDGPPFKFTIETNGAGLATALLVEMPDDVKIKLHRLPK